MSLPRTAHRVALTQEGGTLLNIGRQLLADWENTEEAMYQRSTLQCGKISIAAILLFAINVLSSVLKTSRGPYFGINITVHDAISGHVIEMVSEGRVEMGIALGPDYPGYLYLTPLGVDRFTAIMPPTCQLVGRDCITWRGLLMLDFIILQRPSTVRLILEEQPVQSRHTLEVTLESHQLVTVSRLVANGLGGSAVPVLCRMQMTELGATCIDLDTPMIQRRVGVLYSTHRKLPTASEVLVDSLKEAYCTRLFSTVLIM